VGVSGNERPGGVARQGIGFSHKRSANNLRVWWYEEGNREGFDRDELEVRTFGNSLRDRKIRKMVGGRV